MQKELQKYEHNEFLQSDEWAGFQRKLGRKVFEIKTNGLSSKIIKQDFPFGKNFLFVPRGPVGGTNKKNLWVWLNKLKELGKQEKAIFIHIEPQWSMGHKNSEALINHGCKKSEKKIEPLSTYLLGISPSTEEIFKNLSRGMRYNINYSQRHGLKALIKEDRESVDDFIKILGTVKNNLKFKPFSENYYKIMAEELLGNIMKIISIEYENKIISSTIFIFFNNRATALHTFAIDECKKLKCLSFALWQGILHAKTLGCNEFDFWGSEDCNKKLQGSAQLKKYFNAYKYEYAEPLDCVLDKKYYFLWKIYRKLRSPAL